MSETRRLLEAATALSQLLRSNAIPHAIHGSVLVAVLSNADHCDEIFCIVEGGQTQTHPFRRVRDAISGSENFTTTHSPWTNRLHVTYRRLIPAIEIEILPAGEAGPRHLDSTTVMKINGVPFLTISEFIRAKLKSWIIRRVELDAQDISYAVSRYWNRVDINRIAEHDMNLFVSRNPGAAPAWLAIKRKYGM
ncbi:hypothetical protein C8J56DRAFT_914139 [Mycena floridula]|nr:hypothetical protein C8J56DRAFT_914139 [Mycena floridula]